MKISEDVFFGFNSGFRFMSRLSIGFFIIVTGIISFIKIQEIFPYWFQAIYLESILLSSIYFISIAVSRLINEYQDCVSNKKRGNKE